MNIDILSEIYLALKQTNVYDEADRFKIKNKDENKE